MTPRTERLPAQLDNIANCLQAGMSLPPVIQELHLLADKLRAEMAQQQADVPTLPPAGQQQKPDNRMSLLEMIGEWHKGCSCSTPDHPEACDECTGQLVRAIERRLIALRPDAEALAAEPSLAGKNALVLYFDSDFERQWFVDMIRSV